MVQSSPTLSAIQMCINQRNKKISSCTYWMSSWLWLKGRGREGKSKTSILPMMKPPYNALQDVKLLCVKFMSAWPSSGWNDGIIYCHAVCVLLICNSDGPPFQIIMDMMDTLCSWGQKGLREQSQSWRGDTSHRRASYCIIAVGSCLNRLSVSSIVYLELLLWHERCLNL